MSSKRDRPPILPANQQRAYDVSLVAHKKACSLAYKLGGGRLNDPPKRSTKDQIVNELSKLLRDRRD